MRYAMLIKPHPNTRYRDSLKKLALIEGECLLRGKGAQIELCTISGSDFLVAEIPGDPGSVIRQLSPHSSVCLLAEYTKEGLLRPLERPSHSFLPEDLPEVLKYKGKTSTDFTRMMINCALSLVSSRSQQPLALLDPVCGKGTTLFCGLLSGLDVWGTDVDSSSLREADTYLQRSLKLHRLKHQREEKSMTLAGLKAVRTVEYQIFGENEELSLGLAKAEVSILPKLFRQHFDLVVGDLPYGVQHAPHEGNGLTSLPVLAQHLMEACQAVLRPGGAAALSFNTNTLSKKEMLSMASAHGLIPVLTPPCDDFSHWVEQAVTRDVILLKKEGQS